MGWGGVAMIFLIAYDISADRRRNRVAKLLQSWGYRIQESVFQLRVTQADISVIIEDLGKSLIRKTMSYTFTHYAVHVSKRLRF